LTHLIRYLFYLALQFLGTKQNFLINTIPIFIHLLADLGINLSYYQCHKQFLITTRLHMTEQDASVTQSFTIGDFTILTNRNLIVHRNTEISITPKMLAVLFELAKYQGQTLSKEQLFKAGWGATITTDMVLSRAIADLRKLFGDSAQTQSYIETVSKKGYRLKQSVHWISEDKEQSNQSRILRNKINRQTISLVVISFLVVSLTLLYLNSISQNSHYSNAPLLENLTTDHDRERRVRFSPDGQYIIYSKNSVGDGVQQLVLHSLINQKKSTLTQPTNNSDPNDIAAVFSPDSKQIAYRNRTEQDCHIGILNISNNIQRRLVQCPLSSVNNLDWSPNGQYIITTQFSPAKKKESLVLLSVNSGEFKLLSTPKFDGSGYLFPRFSPNGNKIAVIYLRPSDKFWVVGLIDSKSGDFLSVFQSQQKINQVVWGGSNHTLYYVLDSGTRAGIWKFDLKNKQQTHILNGNIMDLDFNRLTKQFSFTQQNKKTGIWKSYLSERGEIVEELIVDSAYQNSEPRLSPDDHLLAYISTRSGVDSIWTKNLISGKSEQQFRNSDVKITDLSWSPKGNRLCFTLADGNRSWIVIFDLATKILKEFQSSGESAKGQWSADEKHFYWMEKNQDSWFLKQKNLANKSVKTILEKSIKHYQIFAGNSISYQEILSNEIYSHDLNSTTRKDIIINKINHFNSWDAHENILFFTAWSEEKSLPMLYQATINSDSIKELFPLNIKSSAFSEELSVSYNGKSAYFSKLANLNYDIILMSQR